MTVSAEANAATDGASNGPPVEEPHDRRAQGAAQAGEDLVTNPSSPVPEERLPGSGEEFTTTLLPRSNPVGEDARALSDTHIAAAPAALLFASMALAEIGAAPHGFRSGFRNRTAECTEVPRASAINDVRAMSAGSSAA